MLRMKLFAKKEVYRWKERKKMILKTEIKTIIICNKKNNEWTCRAAFCDPDKVEK